MSVAYVVFENHRHKRVRVHRAACHKYRGTSGKSSTGVWRPAVTVDAAAELANVGVRRTGFPPWRWGACCRENV